MDKPSPFETVALIGTGLIGASFALAMKEAKLSKTIIGFDADPDILSRAVTSSVIDKPADSLEAALREADFIVLATPVGAFSSLCTDLNTHVRSGTIIIDVGLSLIHI